MLFAGERSWGAGMTRTNATWLPTANAAGACKTSAAIHFRSIGDASILLKPSRRSLARWKNLETRRPPASLDRLDEFAGKSLRAHFSRESLTLLSDRAES